MTFIDTLNDRRVNRTLFYAIVICALSVLVCRLCLLFSYSPDIAGLEEFQLILLKLTYKSGNPYTLLNKPPCLAVPYAPFYYHALTTIFRFLPIDINNVRSIYIAGRSTNLFLNLVNVFVIYIVCREFGMNKIFSIGTALIFFIFLFFDHYAVRPDTLKLFFVSLHLLFTIKAVKKDKGYLYVILSSFFLCCAVFTKQDSLQLLLPATLSFFLLCENRILKLAIFSITFIFSLLCFLYLMGFDRELLKVTATSIYWGMYTGINLKYFLMTSVLGFIIPFMPLIVISFVCGYRLMADKALQNPVLKMLPLYVGLSFIFSFAFSLRLGAMPVYYAEFMLFMLLLLAVNYSLSPKKKSLGLAVFYATMLTLLTLYFTNNKMGPDLKVKFEQSEEISKTVLKKVPQGLMFSYDPLIDVFIADRLSAPNLGYEFYRHWFYTEGYQIETVNYNEMLHCDEPQWLIATEKDEMQAYIKKMDLPYAFDQSGSGYFLFVRK